MLLFTFDLVLKHDADVFFSASCRCWMVQRLQHTCSFILYIFIDTKMQPVIFVAYLVVKHTQIDLAHADDRLYALKKILRILLILWSPWSWKKSSFSCSSIYAFIIIDCVVHILSQYACMNTIQAVVSVGKALLKQSSICVVLSISKRTRRKIAGMKLKEYTATTSCSRAHMYEPKWIFAFWMCFVLNRRYGSMIIFRHTNNKQT